MEIAFEASSRLLRRADIWWRLRDDLGIPHGYVLEVAVDRLLGESRGGMTITTFGGRSFLLTINTEDKVFYEEFSPGDGSSGSTSVLSGVTSLSREEFKFIMGRGIITY